MGGDKLPKPTDALLQQVAAKHVKAPHVSEFAEAIFTEFGGATGLAREVKLLYDEATKPNKISLMRAMLKLVVDNTQLGGASEDVSAMTEKDLKQTLRELLK